MAAEVGKVASLSHRFWEYQAERFPVGQYAPLVAVFTFSAVAYSRLLRGQAGFIPLDRFAAGVVTSLALFFLLRVLDEHKDAAEDRVARAELPVPRGLISLAELRGIAGWALAVAFGLNALLAPRLLWACFLALAWAALMTREFFAGPWLRTRPTAYLLSHMAIMPLIDGYTTGLDWLAAGARPPAGLWLFLLVTYLNGCVLEIGRKIRTAEEERPGWDTYTRVWGPRAAPAVWLGVLAATAGVAWLAARATHAGWPAGAGLAVMLALAAIPGARFTRFPSRRGAAAIERASGLWTLGMYLLLGAGPFVARWLGA